MVPPDCESYIVLFCRFDAQIGLYEENAGVRRYGVREPDVGTDDGTGSDGGFAAEDRCIGIDGHVVFDGGMAFGQIDGVRIGNAEGAERDTLVDFDVISDDGRFADDDAGAVVDEEGFADLRRGVDVNSRAVVHVFAHHARQNRHAARLQDMGQAVHGQCTQTGIGQDDFGVTLCGRVALVGGMEIGVDEFADFGEFVEEILGDAFCVVAGRIGMCVACETALRAVVGVIEAIGDQLDECGIDFGNAVSDRVLQAAFKSDVIDKPRIDEGFELVCEFGDVGSRGKRPALHIGKVGIVLVGTEEFFDDIVDHGNVCCQK